MEDIRREDKNQITSRARLLFRVIANPHSAKRLNWEHQYQFRYLIEVIGTKTNQHARPHTNHLKSLCKLNDVLSQRLIRKGIPPQNNRLIVRIIKRVLINSTKGWKWVQAESGKHKIGCSRLYPLNANIAFDPIRLGEARHAVDNPYLGEVRTANWLGSAFSRWQTIP